MTRPGYNETRRNRNIGTAKAGHGQDNRLVIPWAWADHRIYYERLVDPVKLPVTAGSVPLHIVVEPPLRGFVHACTVDDVLRVLGMVPAQHLERIRTVVLRQPKRKERILKNVWGRLVYWADIGQLSGPAIYLEAQEVTPAAVWSKSLNPEDAAELDRLRQDGHSIVSDNRCHKIHGTLESVRNTQLYRTLPHEVGHYVDYLEKVVEPSGCSPEVWTRLNDRYHKRPSMEREAYANRYADEFRRQKSRERLLPFDRMLDERRIEEAGLQVRWFEETD